MLPLVFLSGALTGAAGLALAAMWDKKRVEEAFPEDLKRPEKLNVEATVNLLNCYFFSAQKCYAKCNEIVLKSTDLISTPIELPDDGIFQKTANFVGGGANRLCRNWREQELLTIKKEVANLFSRYNGVFKHANNLLVQKGEEPVSLMGIALGDVPQKIDSSLENDNWDEELGSLADSVIRFIELSCEVSERLVDKLEKGLEQQAIEGGEE